MKQTPKILLGVCASLILASLLFLIFSKAKSTSANSLLLTLEKNKFKVAFQVNNQNQDELVSALVALNLPTSAKDGVEFELDSTTSAKLAFLTPIKTSLIFSPKQLSLEGTLDYTLESAHIRPEPIKLPADTAFATFAKDLSTFVKRQSDLQPATQKWLDENLKIASGHYLIIFKGGNFALFFKNKSINFGSLQELNGDSSRKIYLLESAADNSQKLSNNLLLFQIEPWNIITSSQETGNSIEIAQTQGSFTLDLAPISQDAVFVALLKNPQLDLSNEFLQALISVSGSSNLNRNKLTEVLNNIKQASFALKQNHFSALIVFK